MMIRMRKLAFGLLTLALAVPSSAAPGKAKKKAAAKKDAGPDILSCAPSEFLGKYQDKNIGVMFAAWHPMELELVLKDSFYKDTQDEAYFKGDFSTAMGAIAKAVDAKDAAGAASKSAVLTTDMRQRVRNEAEAVRAAAIAVQDQADPPLLLARFVDCRMELAGKSSEFKARKAAQVSPEDRKKFWRYWRAFMSSELRMYQNESASLAADKPVDYKKLFSRMVGSAAGAVEDKDPKARADMFANAGIEDTSAPKEPAPVAKKPEAASPLQLSDDERKFLTKEQDDQYARELAGAKSAKEPDYKAGTPSKEDVVAKYRAMAAAADPSMNLSPAELKQWGDAKTGKTAEQLKADIEKLSGDERRNLVAARRAQLPRLKFAKSKDALQRMNDDPSFVLQGMDGNLASGTVSNPPPVQVGGRGNTKPDDSTAAEKEQTKGNVSGPVPAPDKAEAKEKDDTLKKELPGIGNGIRMGAWAAILGFFVGGPAGALLFGCAGLIGGYGLTKLNKILSSD